MENTREDSGIYSPFMYIKQDSLYMAGPTKWFYHDYNKEDSIEITNKFVTINVFIGQTEVSNRQYRLFLNSLKTDSLFDKYEKCKPKKDRWYRNDSLNPFYISMLESYHDSAEYSDYPVVNISFEAMKEYVNWLNRKEPSKNIIYKLPGIDEWLHAFNTLPESDSSYAWETSTYCRKNNTLLGNFAILNSEQIRYNQVTDDMWFNNYKEEGFIMKINGPLPVYSYHPNKWGTYNMSGNVAEIVDIPKDSIGDKTVYWTKGGSWVSPPYYCRKHAWERYTLPNPCVGFRIVKYELTEIE